MTKGKAPKQPKEDDILGANMQPDQMPPVTIKQLVDTCPQVRAYIRAKSVTGYSHWHMMLGLLRHVVDGRTWAHKLSEGERYDRDACDAKLDEQEAKDIGPTSCEVLDQVCGTDLCKKCIFWGKVKSPMVAARWPKPAKEAPPPPKAEPGEPDPKAKRERQHVPAGFYMTDKNEIAQWRKNKEGVEYPHIILRHDLYPSLRQTDAGAETDQHEWNTKLPFEQPKSFLLESGIIHNDKLLASLLSKQGIYVLPDNLKAVQTFMSAYVQDLLAAVAAETQYGHVGWDKAKTSFILHDKIIHPDGTTTPVALNREAQVGLLENRGVGKMGTLARQVELMDFYNHPEYITHQFYVICGLAAPMLFATGHHGAIINATGSKGSSKSSAGAVIGSFWGSPTTYPMSALKKGITPAALSLQSDILANLPVVLDEITNMAADVAKEFALSVSQANNQETATRGRKLRQGSGGHRATFWMTTSNKSLQSLIAQDNPAGTAGAARVIEIAFPKSDKRNKVIASEWLYDLNLNYGHIGEALMLYIVPRLEEVSKRIREEMARLDIAGDIDPGERFWSTPAAAFVVCEIANELGLLKFNVDELRAWYINVQLPEMRKVVKDEYPTALSVMSTYIEKISSNLVYATKDGNISRVPNSSVFGRYEKDIQRMWLLRDAFKDHCTAKKATSTDYIAELVEMGVILEPSARKSLGQGTEVEKGRSYCLLLDMSHPEMAEIDDTVRRKNFKVA